jgi:hypothetical protein
MNVFSRKKGFLYRTNRPLIRPSVARVCSIGPATESERRLGGANSALQPNPVTGLPAPQALSAPRPKPGKTRLEMPLTRAILALMGSTV